MLFHTGTAHSKIRLTHLGLQVFKATIIIRFSLPKVCPRPFLRLYLMYYSNFFCSVMSTSIFGEFFGGGSPACHSVINFATQLWCFLKKKCSQKTKITLFLSSVNWFSYWSKTAYIWCEKWSKSEWMDEWNIYAQIDRDVTTCGVSRYHAWGLKQCGKYSRLPVLTLCIDWPSKWPSLHLK